MQYRLIRAVDEPQTMTVWVSGNGKAVAKRMTLRPNETYVTDDPILLEFFAEKETLFTYNSTLIEALNACNAKYRIETCKTCGGLRKKLFVKVVEIGNELD